MTRGGSLLGITEPLGNIDYQTLDANDEWFLTDITTSIIGASALRIFVCANKAIKIEFTLNSGTNWYKLNSDDNLVANAAYIFAIAIRNGDMINFRLTGVDDVVVLARIDEIYTES